MNCDEFRREYLKAQMFDEEILVDRTMEAAWLEHLKSCSECGEWYQARIVESRGEAPERYACVHLAYFVTAKCAEHEDPFDCPEAVVIYAPELDEYAIPVRTEKGSLIPISHCPWCGIELPQTKREEWLEELAKRGIDDPTTQEVPEEFRTDRWWRAD